MGAGASQAAVTTAAPTVPDTQDFCVATAVTFFPATPLDAVLQQRAPEVVLEVGRQGFRVLRPKTHEPLAAFPFTEVHSWAHGPGRFSFKYYDERVKTVLDYSFRVSRVGELLAVINKIIHEIMSEREGHVVSDAEFAALQEALASQPADAKPALIVAVAKGKFFTAAQGRQLMAGLDSNFDRMDVACALHLRLLDQTQFSVLLAQLESPGDIDNVWHRIAAARRPQFQALRKASSRTIDVLATQPR